MEPMPPLENAVHSSPPRVEPPTWADRHPRVKALGFLVMWASLLLFSLKSLSRDGFSWVSAITAGLAATSVVWELATFPWRGGTDRSTTPD